MDPIINLSDAPSEYERMISLARRTHVLNKKWVEMFMRLAKKSTDDAFVLLHIIRAGFLDHFTPDSVGYKQALEIYKTILGNIQVDPLDQSIQYGLKKYKYLVPSTHSELFEKSTRIGEYYERA
jgi:hypothetical protein